MSILNRIPTPLLAAAAALAVFAAVVAALMSSRGVSPRVAADAVPPAPRTAQAVIDRAQATLAEHPDDDAALGALAGASLDQARTTGDPSWLTTADRAAHKVLAAEPRDFGAMDDLGSLALTRHRFAEALSWSRRSLAVAPTRVAPIAIRADALIELGRYGAGFAAVQQRLALRPDLPSYSRASYALELQGERAAATRLMEMAVSAGGVGTEGRAWAQVQLGLLRFGGGDLAGAATLYSRAIDTVPLPEYPAALAEVDAALGRTSAARQDLALVHAMQRLLAANGSNIDLDAALIRADTRVPTAADIGLARRAHAGRPGVIGDQVLGWVLTRAGRCAEGDRYATRSLRLGTRDALMLFHAGMAASCDGRPALARQRLRAALDLNPAFSVRWAPVARRALAGLS